MELDFEKNISIAWGRNENQGLSLIQSSTQKESSAKFKKSKLAVDIQTGYLSCSPQDQVSAKECEHPLCILALIKYDLCPEEILIINFRNPVFLFRKIYNTDI